MTCNDIRYTAIKAALAILSKCNQRTNAVKHATAYLRKELDALPICWANFHDKTAAIWEPAGAPGFPFARSVDDSYLPTRRADFVSASGSQYWAVDGGVIRLADHWGSGIRSCDWYLRGGSDGSGEPGHSSQLAVAYCAYASFAKIAPVNGCRGFLPYSKLEPTGSPCRLRRLAIRP